MRRCGLRLAILALTIGLAVAGCAPRPTAPPPVAAPPSPVPPAAPAPAVSNFTGAAEEPDQSQLPGVRELGPGQFGVGPLREFWQPCLSPDGRNLAVLTDDGRSLAIFPTTGDRRGRVVITWRYGGPPVSESDWEYVRTRVSPVGWADDSHVLFLAGETQPGVPGGDWGLSLWRVDVNSESPERLAWVGAGRFSDSPQTRWVTADRRAAIIQCRDDENRTVFTVVDLNSAKSQVVTAKMPVYEPSALSMYYRSPDGWRVVWQEPNGGWEPAPGKAVLLDLKTGNQTVIYDTGSGGLMAGLNWSPDGRYVALFSAKPGDQYASLLADSWVTFLAPACTVVRLDGTVAADFRVPNQTWCPYAYWSPQGDRLCLVVADAVSLPQPDEWGNDKGIGYNGVYAATPDTGSLDIIGDDSSPWRKDHPTPVFVEDRISLSRTEGERRLTGIYNLNGTCWTELGEHSLFVVDGQPTTSAGGWLVTGPNSLGLTRTADSAPTAALLDETWYVFTDHGEWHGQVLKYNAAQGDKQYAVVLQLGNR